MTDFTLPDTRYAASGDINIAYQTMGSGPFDIIMVPGFISHVEFAHELIGYTGFLCRLATFARVVTFDKRGQGLSDRVADAPTFEERIDDVRAIMDQIDSKRAIVMGFSEGCAMSALFAATYPDRVSQLILFGGYATAAFLTKDMEAKIEQTGKAWGAGEIMKTVIPSQAADQTAVLQFAKMERLSASPGGVKAILSMNAFIDVRPILPSIRIPTLILHRSADQRVPVQLGRDLAAQIPGGKFIEYPGVDHAFWSGDVDTMLGDIEEFVTGHRDNDASMLERVLATVMFTDIIDSTRKAAELGDQRWRSLLDNHDHLARKMIDKYRGSFVKMTGDGVLATFDGPGRAIRCAIAFGNAAKQIGLTLRVGLHTGEIELRNQDIGGIAVHAAARVMAQARSNEILVSRVVADLVAGAGLTFSERGTYELKGIPGRWDLFAAAQ